MAHFNCIALFVEVSVCFVLGNYTPPTPPHTGTSEKQKVKGSHSVSTPISFSFFFIKMSSCEYMHISQIKKTKQIIAIIS